MQLPFACRHVVVATIALSVGACSVVTGLNKDYTFEEDGSASDGGKNDGAATGDGASTGDATGGTDGATGKDSGGGGAGASCTSEAPCERTLSCCGNFGDPSLLCSTAHDCQGKKVVFDCTRSNDCGLQACCLQQGSGGTFSSSCAAVCADKELCDLNEPKCKTPGKTTCMPTQTLPPGFGICN